MTSPTVTIEIETRQSIFGGPLATPPKQVFALYINGQRWGDYSTREDAEAAIETARSEARLSQWLSTSEED